MELDKSPQKSEEVGDNAAVWEKRFAEGKRKEKIVQYIRFGIAGVLAVVLIIAFVSFYRWTGKDAFGRLESYKSVQRTMNVSIVFVCIIFGIKVLLEAFNGLILTFFCRKKLLLEKWDTKSYIKKHPNDITAATARKKSGACVTAAYWTDNPKACNLEILNSVIRAVLGIVAVICVGVFFTRFFDVALTTGLTMSKFEFSDCDWRPLIAAVVFAVLDIIALFVFYSVKNKGFDEWLESAKK